MQEDLILKEISVKDLRNMINMAVIDKIEEAGYGFLNYEEPLVKAKEIMQMFSVSYQSIRNWQNKGLIPYYKVSRATYYKKSEVMYAIRRLNG
jgi:hypothetical protein